MHLYLTAIVLVAPILLLLPSLFLAGGNTQNQSFSKAKKLLHTVVYADRRTAFRCGCGYDETKKIVISTRGYRPKSKSERAERVEWDHVVPADSFGQSFKEWREGHPDCVEKNGTPFKGRKCAEKVNLTYW